MENKPLLVFFAEHKKWTLYKNGSGMIEAYRRIGGKREEESDSVDNAKDLERIVTTSRTIEEFEAFIKRPPPHIEEIRPIHRYQSTSYRVR